MTMLNPAPARRNLDMGVVTQASFLIPNETELAILTDMPVESEAEISAAAQSLVSQGVETVIVTLGARGALLATREGAERIAPVKVEAVDTTGAGDAFIGSFARYLAGGLSLEAALVEATRLPPSRSPATGRRNHIRPRPSSTRSDRISGETGKAVTLGRAYLRIPGRHSFCADRRRVRTESRIRSRRRSSPESPSSSRSPGSRQ